MIDDMTILIIKLKEVFGTDKEKADEYLKVLDFSENEREEILNKFQQDLPDGDITNDHAVILLTAFKPTINKITDPSNVQDLLLRTMVTYKLLSDIIPTLDKKTIDLMEEALHCLINMWGKEAKNGIRVKLTESQRASLGFSLFHNLYEKDLEKVEEETKTKADKENPA